MRRKGWIASTFALAGTFASLLPAIAQGQSYSTPWDGSNPFNCQLQNVGTGTDFPHPEADPFCVEFDKTSQNVTDLGLVDFLSNEPARVAAASPKCFYFQRDHWTGSVVQGQPPELWHWDGSYFFDKAKGIGGVSFANLRIGGQPADSTPYVPDAFKPYVYPGGGGGGAITQISPQGDPACMAKVDTPKERQGVYRNEPQFPECIRPNGKLHRRGAAGARLGMKRNRLIDKLGEPRKTKRRVDRWCIVGAAQLRVAYRRAGSGKAGGGKAILIRTSSRGHTTHGIGPGVKGSKAKRRLNLEPRFRIRHTKVFEAPSGRTRSLFAGIRKGRVRWLAVGDPAMAGKRATKSALRRAS